MQKNQRTDGGEITGVTGDMRVAQEEIFGPLLPIVEYRILDQVIVYIQARPRPLALYPFSLDARKTERVLKETHSGGVTLGDWACHVSSTTCPSTVSAIRAWLIPSA
ncbi:aldehyde dehydrogenase family protein [Pseudomonas fluorescens]|uniref:aldehyde dehydrogenase family protein n=1 Tax=Pseudomonas fluorescens TaxID=294 RepID=UPI001CD73A07|nr:aldehyde dehydrogenase family protein [Pseudomonas fluorescens]